MRRLILFSLILFLAPILIGGCAGPGKPPVTIREERIVERSQESRPDWILTPISIQEGMFSFSGGVEGRPDYSLALRQARGEVIKNIIEGIKSKIQTEFSGAASGLGISDDELSELLTETVGKIMDIYQMHGLKPKETYYEKIERSTAEGIEYFYNCYQLVELSEGEYIEWRNGALISIRDKAKAENDKKKETIATQILKKLSE